MIKIECPPHILFDLNCQVLDGFHRFRRGGVEVGGVLLGKRDDRGVLVLGYRPIECEHALGPGFLLSGPDTEALNLMLERLRADSESQGSAVVGWYRSNTRSHIHLSPADVALFDRHFPEPWQVALLLKPDCFAPTRAGFFVREGDGSIEANSSCQEFSLPSPGAATSFGKVDRGIVSEPATLRQSPPPPASQGRGKSVAIGIFAAVAISLILIGFAAKEKPLESRRPFALVFHDQDGQLRIGWNRTAGPISLYRNGWLKVTESGRVTVVDLHGDQLQRGTVVYNRSSANVEVNLKVGDTEETAVFAATTPFDRPRQERVREAADWTPPDLTPEAAQPPVVTKNTRRQGAQTLPRGQDSPLLKRPPARR